MTGGAELSGIINRNLAEKGRDFWQWPVEGVE